MEDDDEKPHGKPPGHHGLVVRETRCKFCLYGSKPLVLPEQVADITKACRRADNHFVCHEATSRGFDVCCRGFYDIDPGASNYMRIMGRLGGVSLIPGDELLALPIDDADYDHCLSVTKSMVDAKARKR